MADAPKYLSREDMLAALKAGKSVLYNGEVITDPARLPSEADLAAGDAQRQEQALRAVEGRIEALKAEHSKLLQQQAAQEQQKKDAAERQTQQAQAQAKAQQAAADEEGAGRAADTHGPRAAHAPAKQAPGRKAD